jgi:hypothetical protein
MADHSALIAAIGELTEALRGYTVINQAILEVLLDDGEDEQEAEPARYLDGTPIDTH